MPVAEQLAARRIYVAPGTAWGDEEHVRVTLFDDAATDRLLAALRELLIEFSSVPPETWSWLGEPLAIDFANTVRRRGSDYTELLATGADLRAWAEHEAARVPDPSEYAADTRLGEVRELRDAIFALLLAAAQRRPAPVGIEKRVNAALSAVPLVPQLSDGAIDAGRPAGRRSRRRAARPHRELGARAARLPRARLLRRPELRPVLPAQPPRPALVRAGVRHPHARGAPREACPVVVAHRRGQITGRRNACDWLGCA